MFYLYVLAAFIVAFAAGCGLLYAVVMSGVGSVYSIIAVGLVPTIGYWLGLICMFFYCLGEAFKGG